MIIIAYKCGYKVRQSEAKQSIGAINRGQQAYFFEKKTFANSIDNLELGIKTETENYSYSIKVNENNSINYAIAKHSKKSES